MSGIKSASFEIVLSSQVLQMAIKCGLCAAEVVNLRQETSTICVEYSELVENGLLGERR